MEQLDLFKGHLNNNQIKRELPIPIQKQKTSKKIVDVLSGTLNYDFNNLKYSCYKIEVNNGKIIKIYFKIGEYKFQVYIDYEFKKDNIRQLNYTETNKDDRENFIETVKVKKLHISAIQKKEKSGYGRVYKVVNYFKYAGVEYNQIISFLEALIKNYHK